MQHALLSGSHTALFLNLQVVASQQVELESSPGSQSSPDSTMPLPHIFSVINGLLVVSDVGALGSIRQVVFMFALVMREPAHSPSVNTVNGPDTNYAQMLPILHGEKFISPVSATGLMMNCELASQDATLLGQQLTPLVLQPPEHEQPSAQSCYNRKNTYQLHV